jgi:Flp pilus assembly protein TadD
MTLKGFPRGVTAAAFSPDGQMLVAGDMDSNVRLWRANPVAESRIYSRQPAESGESAFDDATLAGLLFRQHRLPEAEQACRDALVAYSKTEGIGGAGYARIVELLLQTLTAEHKLSEAESLMKAALPPHQQSSGKPNVTLAATLFELADLLKLDNKPDAAAKWYREAAEIISSSRDHGALAEQAHLLLTAGQFAAAEPLARKCLAIREEQIPGDWRTFNARDMLGASLLGQKKYAEAEPLLVAGYEGLKCREHLIPLAGKPRLQEALERLVQLNDSLATESPGRTEGRQELAAAYRQLLNLTTNTGPLAAQDCNRALALTDKAIALARKDTNATPAEAALWYDKGKLLEAAGWREEALDAMAKAIELASANTNGYALTPADALLRRSGLLQRMNRLAEAGDDRCQALNFPRRDPQARTNLLDLSLFYNANLRQNWHGGSADDNLDVVPTGIQTFAGTEFDIRGLIQLTGGGLRARVGDRYPASVGGIPIHRKFARLHVLHATNYSEAEAKKVGAYALHYADGRQVELPILYGQDLRDWWQAADSQDATQLAVAWTGTNPAASKRKALLRLFKHTWDNPHPEAEVESLDFTSTETKCAPFLIALTVE